MNKLLYFIVSLTILSCSQANATVKDCKMGISGSGSNNFAVNAQGTGTKESPYQLVYDEPLCDITLVKNKQGTNLSYPDNTIYFEYKYSNIPLKFDPSTPPAHCPPAKNGHGTRCGNIPIVNAFYVQTKMATPNNATFSVIKDSSRPFFKNRQCSFSQEHFSDPTSKDPFKEDTSRLGYFAECQYGDSAFKENPKPKAMSGSFQFSLSIQDNQEVKGIKLLNKDGSIKQQGANLVIVWEIEPQHSNYDLEK